MPEFEVLGTGEEVDPTQPVDAGKTIGMLVGGAALLFMVLPIGQQLGGWINGQLADVLNMDVGDTVTFDTNGGGL